jgi:hypothetical protein
MKVCIVVAAALALILLVLNNAGARAETALEMSSNCRSVGNASISQGKVFFPISMTTGLCWGAFAAIQDLVAKQWHNGSMVLGFCVPPLTTRIDLVKVFLKYSDDHPELGHEEFTDVVTSALYQAYQAQPCKKL